MMIPDGATYLVVELSSLSRQAAFRLEHGLHRAHVRAKFATEVTLLEDPMEALRYLPRAHFQVSTTETGVHVTVNGGKGELPLRPLDNCVVTDAYLETNSTSVICEGNNSFKFFSGADPAEDPPK